MRTRPLLGSILCVLTAIAGVAAGGCKKLEASKAETTNAAVPADPTPKSAPTPVCAADGSAQTDVQVIPETMNRTEHARISKLVGKTVTVSGQAEEAVTAHHHRPVVVFGKITAR